MLEQKESSVLFSLKSLMSLEEIRIREEQEAQQRRAREEAELRAEAERQSRAAEEQRMRDEEQRRSEREQRKTEEAARLAAIREAEIEKARAEVEHRARMEALAAKQLHEATLAALKSDRSKTRLKRALGLGGGLVVAAAFGIFAAWRGTEQERLARERSLLAEQQRTAAELARLEGEFESAQKRGEVLHRDLTKARDALNQREKSPSDSVKDSVKPPRGNTASPPTSKQKRDTEKPCTCPPDDPICGCL